jgi:hypothetical protein
MQYNTDTESVVKCPTKKFPPCSFIPEEMDPRAGPEAVEDFLPAGTQPEFLYRAACLLVTTPIELSRLP